MHSFSRFPVPELGTLPEDIRARIVSVHEKAGFIPNVFLAWAHRPAEFPRVSLRTMTRCWRKQADSRRPSAR